jgi:hypothetical protein
VRRSSTIFEIRSVLRLMISVSCAGSSGRVRAEQLGRAGDRGDRGAQLVRRGGEPVGPHLVDLLELRVLSRRASARRSPVGDVLVQPQRAQRPVVGLDDHHRPLEDAAVDEKVSSSVNGFFSTIALAVSGRSRVVDDRHDAAARSRPWSPASDSGGSSIE